MIASNSVQCGIKQIKRSGISKLNLVSNGGLYFPKVVKDEVVELNKKNNEFIKQNKELSLNESVNDPDIISASPIGSSFMKDVQKRMDFYYSSLEYSK